MSYDETLKLRVTQLLRRDWSVRVIDEWQEKVGREVWTDRYDFDTGTGYTLSTNDEFGDEKEYRGASFEAVRLASAKDLFPSLSDEFRDELGGCP